MTLAAAAALILPAISRRLRERFKWPHYARRQSRVAFTNESPVNEISRFGRRTNVAINHNHSCLIFIITRLFRSFPAFVFPSRCDEARDLYYSHFRFRGDLSASVRAVSIRLQSTRETVGFVHFCQRRNNDPTLITLFSLSILCFGHSKSITNKVRVQNAVYSEKRITCVSCQSN